VRRYDQVWLTQLRATRTRAHTHACITRARLASEPAHSGILTPSRRLAVASATPVPCACRSFTNQAACTAQRERVAAAAAAAERAEAMTAAAAKLAATRAELAAVVEEAAVAEQRWVREAAAAAALAEGEAACAAAEVLLRGRQ